MNSNSQGIWIKECRILVILCALAFLAPGSPLNADAQRPNILIIFTDDQGYADLGCYGNTKNRTPRLDQLAKEGTRFTSFYSQTVCGPSRSALLTGRQPIRSGGWGMPASEITWAELIRKAGYQTACIGKWDVSNRKPIIERMPNAQGFDYYFGTLGANDGGGVAFHENNERAGNTRDMGSLTRLYTDKAIDFLENKRDKKKPFVLYVAHTMMHTIIGASEKFRGKSKGGLYGDVVEEFDFETGRLLDVLDKQGLCDNTLVIYTSDNGPWNQDKYTKRKKGHPAGSIFWGEAGPLRNGKGSPYEAGYRLPCIVRWPGKIEGNRIEAKSGIMMDWFPTFMAMTGGSMPADRPHDGRDLSDLLFNSGDRSDSEFYANFIAGWYGDVKKHVYEIMEHRSGKWKYVALNGGELYNLEKDISETNNVKSANMKIYNRLKKEYDFFTKSIDKAPAPGDIDGDGMPDAYEKANNLDPLYAIDSYLDPDGNGKTAYEEYLEDLTKKRR